VQSPGLVTGLVQYPHASRQMDAISGLAHLLSFFFFTKEHFFQFTIPLDFENSKSFVESLHLYLIH